MIQYMAMRAKRKAIESKNIGGIVVRAGQKFDYNGIVWEVVELFTDGAHIRSEHGSNNPNYNYGSFVYGLNKGYWTPMRYCPLCDKQCSKDDLADYLCWGCRYSPGK